MSTTVHYRGECIGDEVGEKVRQAVKLARQLGKSQATVTVTWEEDTGMYGVYASISVDGDKLRLAE